MTVYSNILILDSNSITNPTPITRNISSGDTIVVTLDTSSFATGNAWSIYSTPAGCTVSPSSGADGTAATITPIVGATSYSATFRTFDSDFGAFYYGRIAGTIGTTTDTTPDAFTFTDQTGVALSSTITSNTITVSGITAASSISVTGGTYSINGGAYTSASGTVTNGQTVSVQQTSSSSFSTAVNTTLTIGGVSDIFTSTTLAADSTPNAFTFTDQTGVAVNTVITSAAITVSGINTTSAVSITGGTYSINGGAYTSATGTVTNGQTVTVRHTSSASNSTAVNTTLTIGGVSDIFTSTTVAAAADTTPDAFTFTDQTGVALSTVITSAAITVSGINAAASISVSVGSTYSINGGAYTSVAGTVTNGQTVTVRHTSSATNSTAVNTTLTIGGVSDIFTSTTAAAVDTTPNAFTFTDQTGAALSSIATSTTITVSGLSPSISITITASGGTVDAGTSTLSGTFASSKTVTTSATGTLVLAARVTNAAIYSTATNCTVSIGGVSDTFTSTTLAADTTPAAFAFTDVTGATLNTVYTTGTITITGLQASYSITVTASGGTIDAGTSILSGTFATSKTVTTSATGTLVLAARTTSSATAGQTVNCTVTVGTVSDTFSVTTAAAADTTPDAFSFTDQTNVTINTLITSNTITISGLTAAATVTVTGGEYSINSGTYTTAVGSITNLQTISVRHTSSSTTGTATNTTLNIGGVSDIFTSTTTSSGSSYILTPNDTVARAGRQLTVDLYTSDANVLYWTINTTTANFLTIQGTTQGLLYGLGIFVITPTLTCTAGTYTVSLRTGSYTGTVVASFNVQVEATLSATTHGIIVNDSSGTAILDTTYDTTRFLGSYNMTTAYTNASTTPPYVDPPIQTNKGVFVFSPSFVSSSRLGPPSYIIGTDPSGNQPYVKNRIYFTSDALPSSGSLVYLYGEY